MHETISAHLRTPQRSPGTAGDNDWIITSCSGDYIQPTMYDLLYALRPHSIFYDLHHSAIAITVLDTLEQMKDREG